MNIAKNWRKWTPLFIVVVIGVAVLSIVLVRGGFSRPVNSFLDCIARGYPVMESYPRQCKDPASGRTFVEDIGNAIEKADLIQVSAPQPNQKVTSPLTVTGQARGSWYFEASFPVKLFDANNTLLASTTAAAQSDWMTTNFVSFTASLTFSQPSTTTGTLIPYKDNPSGLPQNDDSLIVPVSF